MPGFDDLMYAGGTTTEGTFDDFYYVQVAQRRRELDLRVTGEEVPRPLKSFAQCGFPAEIMKDIR